MQGSSRCLNALKVPNNPTCAKLLPRKLLLQMVKNNNNQHLLALLSLLTIHEVFEEIQPSFLVVGHTHEDIDGSFRYLSKKSRE
jgi:hypothetical protein